MDTKSATAARSLENTVSVDKRTVALNRSLSLPQFEMGYRHDFGGEGRATGFKVGMSVPLFENKNKVKAAKAAAVSSQAQLESARTNAASRFRMLYDQAVALSESMRSMRSALQAQNNLEMLNKGARCGADQRDRLFHRGEPAVRKPRNAAPDRAGLPIGRSRPVQLLARDRVRSEPVMPGFRFCPKARLFI